MGTDAALMSSPTQSRVAALFLSAICLWCCDSCVVEKRASLSPSLPSNSTSGLCWCCGSPALLRDDRLHLAPAFMVVSRMDGGVLIPVMQEELWKGHWQKKTVHARTHTHTYGCIHTQFFKATCPLNIPGTACINKTMIPLSPLVRFSLRGFWILVFFSLPHFAQYLITLTRRRGFSQQRPRTVVTTPLKRGAWSSLTTVVKVSQRPDELQNSSQVDF